MAGPHMELVTGGAQVEAAAHHALQLLDAAETLQQGDPTAAAELVGRARDVLAGGLGQPRRHRPHPWTVEEEGDHAADEARIELAGRAA